MNGKWKFGEFKEEGKPGFGSGAESHLRLPNKNFVEEGLSSLFWQQYVR